MALPKKPRSHRHVCCDHLHKRRWMFNDGSTMLEATWCDIYDPWVFCLTTLPTAPSSVLGSGISSWCIAKSFRFNDSILVYLPLPTIERIKKRKTSVVLQYWWHGAPIGSISIANLLRLSDSYDDVSNDVTKLPAFGRSGIKNPQEAALEKHRWRMNTIGTNQAQLAN